MPARTARHLALTTSLAFALAAPFAVAQTSIDKVNGSITAEAGQAYGDLGTVNGSIRINDGARVQDADTVNGSIKIGNDAQVDDVSTVNGSVRAGTGLRGKDIGTVNGSIFVDRGGQLDDVATVNGSIGLVDSDLSGGIETVRGDITVGAGSHVRGGIKVEKPSGISFDTSKRKPQRIIVGPNAVVEGPLVFEREVKLYVHETARTGPITGATAVRYSGARAPRD